MRDDNVYLMHILDAITQIENYTLGLDRDQFHAQRLSQDGVIRQMEIIGEATKMLSQALRLANADIPWQDFAGMRDKLIHQYFGVDMEEVWLTSQEDIPILKARVTEIRRDSLNSKL